MQQARIKSITGYTTEEIKEKFNTTPLKYYQAIKARESFESISRPATQLEKEECWREDCTE